MYKLILTLVLVLCFRSDVSYFSWNQDHKLQWEDFQGEADHNIDAVAVTASGITFSYSIQKSSTKGIVGVKTEVFAHFYPEHSWCKKELIDDHILAHEQLHFDITELNVRYLKEKIEQLKVSPTIDKQLDSYHEKANAALAQMQKKYDTESQFSIDKSGQATWSAFVKGELKRLESFKSQ